MDFCGFFHVLSCSFLGHLEHLETGIHAFAQDVLDATTAIATEIHGQATGANTAPWKRILEPESWDRNE